MGGLDLTFIEGLMSDDKTPEYLTSLDNGPLRYTSEELTCTNLNCEEKTHFIVQTVPRCIHHSLKRLNELCIEME
jgi:hypothetical protein